jgi:hypothetical protein
MSQVCQGGLVTTAILAGPELSTSLQAVNSASSNSAAHGVPIFVLAASIANQYHLSAICRTFDYMSSSSSPHQLTTVDGPFAEETRPIALSIFHIFPADDERRRPAAGRVMQAMLQTHMALRSVAQGLQFCRARRASKRKPLAV